MDQEQVLNREQVTETWLIESADFEPTVDGVLLCQENDGEPVLRLRTLKDYLEHGG